MTDERAKHRLQSVVIDEDSLGAASRDQEQERQIAVSATCCRSRRFGA